MTQYLHINTKEGIELLEKGYTLHQAVITQFKDHVYYVKHPSGCPCKYFNKTVFNNLIKKGYKENDKHHQKMD
jgi:deoxycytidylate deaminase